MNWAGGKRGTGGVSKKKKKKMFSHRKKLRKL